MLDPIQTKKIIEKRVDKVLKEISDELDVIETHMPSLSKSEIAFVRARQNYLSPKQAEIFKEILAPKQEKKAGKPESK
jgi:hypothetical protein